MANYYHEARAHVRRLKAFSEETKRRAERRAEYAGSQAEHPVNLLTAEGRGVNLQPNKDLYQQIEDGSGMIPWNGEADCMIDRYDGRALIDWIPPHRPSTPRRTQQQTDMDEVGYSTVGVAEGVAQLVMFEAYRDLVRMKSLELPESEILELVEKESVEMRAAAKVAAAQAVNQPYSEFNNSQSASNISSGLTAAYGTTAALLEDGSSSDGSGSDAETPRRRPAKGRVLNRELLDRIGRDEIGIRDFSHKLKRVMKLEGETEALKELRSARPHRVSRRKLAERARRMSGQGYHPDSLSSLRPYRSASFPSRLIHRSEFSRETARVGRHDGQSAKSEEDGELGVRDGELEYITEFHGVPEGGSDLAEVHSTRDVIPMDAVYDVPPEPRVFDPSRLGFEERTEARKRKEEELHRLEQLKSDATARELLRECKKARQKVHQLNHDSPNPASLQETGTKETPQERLKRLTAAQLEKQAKKDTFQSRQKRIQEAKDRATRLQNERSGMGQSYPQSYRGRNP